MPLSLMQMDMNLFKRFFILCFVSVLIPVIADAKVYLVSVGVSDYPDKEMKLRLPVNDARTMTWLYSRNTELTYSQLLDENATVSKILAAMDKVFSKAGSDDIVVLFYSGHGYPGGLAVYDGNLSYNQIRRCMSKSKSRNKMILADACFSGKLRTRSNTTTPSDEETAEGANVMLFLSSRGNETSYERLGMKNGFFTTYLQKGLRGGADSDKNRTITAKEIYEYVHSNVVELSDGKQHPVMWGKFDDDMPVMIW